MPALPHSPRGTHARARENQYSFLTAYRKIPNNKYNVARAAYKGCPGRDQSRVISASPFPCGVLCAVLILELPLIKIDRADDSTRVDWGFASRPTTHADGSKSLKVRGSPTRYLVRGPRGRAENCPRTKVTFRWRGPRGGGPGYNRVTTMYLYGLRRATEDCRVYYRPSRSTACHRCAERGLRLQKRNDHAWDVGRRLIGPTT